MSKQTTNNLFIGFSLPRFYQQILGGITSFEGLGNRIIKRIKIARAFRQTKIVRQLSSILIGFPVQEYQFIGQYYQAWCDYRESKCRTEVLEKIIEQSKTYKTKALFSLAAFEARRGKVETSLGLYAESLKTAPTVSERIELLRSIAVLKAGEGFHALSLKDLESVLPFIRYADPLAYYDFLNSYAVELGEVGRLYEARDIINLVLASPFAFAYPEWRETAQVLREPDRSFVAVSSIKHEHIEFQTTDPHTACKPHQPASVLPFPQLKQAPEPKRPQRVTPKEAGEMDLTQKREFILAALMTGAILESDYTKLMYMLGLVKGGPSEHIIDLEDETLLTDIIIQWVNLIEPEELTAVMSALRDCEDDFRRNNIIDMMIRKAFEYSELCNLTETEWREQYERRLPKK